MSISYNSVAKNLRSYCGFFAFFVVTLQCKDFSTFINKKVFSCYNYLISAYRAH